MGHTTIEQLTDYILTRDAELAPGSETPLLGHAVQQLRDLRQQYALYGPGLNYLGIPVTVDDAEVRYWIDSYDMLASGKTVSEIIGR